MLAISHTLREYFADCVFYLRCPQVSEQNSADICHAIETGKSVLIPLKKGKAETAPLNGGLGLFDTLNMLRRG